MACGRCRGGERFVLSMLGRRFHHSDGSANGRIESQSGLQ